MLVRIARACHRRRWTTLLGWLLAALALASAGGMAGTDFDSAYDLPGTGSQRAYDVLERHFPEQSAGTGDIVLHADAGLDAPGVRERARDVLAAARTADPVVAEVVPFDDAARGGLVSDDGTTATARIVFTVGRTEVPDEAAEKIRQRLTGMSGDGLHVELSGTMFAPKPSTGLSESVGLAAALVILLAAFGSLAMAGLPVLAALTGLLTAMGLVMLLSKAMNVPDFSMSVAVMIVLGVAVDYALFIAARYRGARREGHEPDRAVALAAGTSGAAVLFAGTTVIVSLGGMFFMGVPFVYGLAVSCIVGVAATLGLALTLVPALLGIADRWLTPRGRLERRGAGARGAGAYERAPGAYEKLLRGRPLAVVVGATALLLALCAPLAAMRLGSADAGNAPASDTTRRAHELKQEAFGPGATAPLMVVADLRGASPDDTAGLVERLRRAPGVAHVGPPATSPDGRAQVVTVVPRTDAQDEATPRLVRELRETALPEAAAGTPVRLYVGGVTATFQDLTDRMADRLAVFVLAVVVISALVLGLMFRSPVVSVQAVVLTLLSLGVSYGLLVAVFQWGWASGVLSTGATGPVESYLPMTLMALLFGLGMDYQVFVLARIREARLRGAEAGDAVAEGLRDSRRVVLAAALIMAAVFASFALSPDRIMKQFGLGLAGGVLVAAAAVLVVTPALLTCLGDRAWPRTARHPGVPAAGPRPEAGARSGEPTRT
ncbi:MMPL family transporter [Streptomyces sp. CNQ-509]|uniref:MMPL family transporter n=1 Tax=Streptomyces sp. CNQ-509 TaxID=444103 RepID=UPI0006994691|nr:MMPL family transporter [Streptomyces sp. CNQ-509]